MPSQLDFAECIVSCCFPNETRTARTGRGGAVGQRAGSGRGGAISGGGGGVEVYKVNPGLALNAACLAPLLVEEGLDPLR